MDLDGLDYEDMLIIIKILKQSHDKEYFFMLYALIHIKPLPLDAFMKKTV
jgi:hypothetical protein